MLQSFIQLQNDSRAEEKSAVQPQKPSAIQLLMAPILDRAQRRTGREGSRLITNLLRFTEDKTFLMHSNPLVQEYIGFMLDYNSRINDYDRQVARYFAVSLQSKVADQIECQKIVVSQVNPYLSKQEVDMINNLKLKNAELKKMVSVLNQDFSGLADKQEQTQGPRDHGQRQAKLNSQLQMQNKQFVKQLRLQKAKLRERMKQRSKHIQKSKKQAEQSLKRQLQKQKQARKEELLKWANENELKRKMHERQRQQNRAQLGKILKQHKSKVPLFIKKEIQVKRLYESIDLQRQKRLEQRNKRYKPLDLEGLYMHQQSYLELRRNREAKRKRQYRGVAQYQSKEYYRGRAHQLIQMEKEPAVSERDLAVRISSRRKQYQSLVHQKYKPTVSQQKRKQLVDLELARIGRIERRMQKNVKEIGDQYLDHVRKLRKKTRSQKKEAPFEDLEVSRKDFETVEKKSREKKGQSDWLQRQLKALSVNVKTNNFQSRVEQVREKNRRNQRLLRVLKDQDAYQLKKEIANGLLMEIHSKLQMIKTNSS